MCIARFIINVELPGVHRLLVGMVMINVKGILIPVNWDPKGNVVSLAITTNDENEYLIEDQAMTEKLKRVLW